MNRGPTTRRVIAIIQARLGSTRLPGKMLMKINGTPIVEWVCNRVRRAQGLDAAVAAIPVNAIDDELEAYLHAISMPVYWGSEADVVGRFHRAAQLHEATHVVRVCADNPFIDPHAIDALIDAYFENPCDYAYNHIPRNNLWPDGLGAEIVSADLLETIHEQAQVQSEREHIFNYIWNRADQFKIKTFDPADESLRRPTVKLDVDTP